MLPASGDVVKHLASCSLKGCSVGDTLIREAIEHDGYTQVTRQAWVSILDLPFTSFVNWGKLLKFLYLNNLICKM